VVRVSGTWPRPHQLRLGRGHTSLGVLLSGAREGHDMRGIGKAVTNESKHPYVVKLEVVSDGLDIELSRRIVQFHKLRDIQPQYGRTIFRRSGPDYHWCFDDLSIAHAFIEQFGGELYKAGI
jgi:hypothetical protein